MPKKDNGFQEHYPTIMYASENLALLSLDDMRGTHPQHYQKHASLLAVPVQLISWDSFSPL